MGESIKDKRLALKGMNCGSKEKGYLTGLLKKLGVPEKKTIGEMCESLKLELIHREINAIKEYAHTKAKKTRWFYFHYETPYIRNF